MQEKYNDSIFDTEYGECFFCGYHIHTARHEVYRGNYRQKSKRMGYWVNLCPDCHNEVHKFPNDGIDKWLKQKGQIKFEEKHSREDFIKEFGRNYL